MSLPRLLVLFALCQPHATPAADNVAEVVQHVADVQRQLPWFWSPLLEGLGDIAYTFEMKDTRTFTDRAGKQSHPSTSMNIERIPLIGGSYYRCLMQNGASPCSTGVVNALEADSHKAANFTPEEKAKAKAAKEERRLRRRAFWTDFPKAFRFTLLGPGEITFTPTGAYRAQREPDTQLLRKIRGEFWYNPQTYEITRMEYRMLDDAETISRLYKGSNFSVTLAEIVDGHYFPVKTTVKRELPKGGTETTESEFVNFRAFATDSSITFVDKDHY